jgi:hypothetical protein
MDGSRKNCQANDRNLLNSASPTAPFAHATNLAQLTDEIERWERGKPLQQTMTVPNSHKIVICPASINDRFSRCT